MKVRAVVSAGEAPPRTSSAHLFRRASSATRGGTPRAFCLHRVVCPTRAWDEPPHRPPLPASPREGLCVATKTEVRSTAVLLRDREDRSPFSRKRASSPRGTCAPKNTDALQTKRACAFSTARNARHDEPSIRCGSIERNERLVASPLPNPSIAAPKTASVTDAARGVMCRELREYVFASTTRSNERKKTLQSRFSSPQVLHLFYCPLSTRFLRILRE